MDNTGIIENVEVKPYTLKKLSAEHIFIFTTILTKVGFKEIKNCFNTEDIQVMLQAENEGTTGNMEKVGLAVAMDIAGVVIANLANCKDSIYQLLSDLSGMTKDEIASLDMNVFVSMIIDVFQKEEFKDFFKVVSKLLK